MKKYWSRKNSDIEGIGELLENNLDSDEEINDKYSNEQVGSAIPNLDEVMCNINNSIMPEDRHSDLVNEDNEKVLFYDCDSSGIETVIGRESAKGEARKWERY